MIKLNIIMKRDERMLFFWPILIISILVVILFVVVHRLIVNRATMILRKNAQDVTQKAVNTALSGLLGYQFNLSAEIVADVWGKGVLAFEFHFKPKELNVDLTNISPEILDKALADYANKNNIKAVNKKQSAFKVTDWWTYTQVLHIDVAYVINQPTLEYISDLKRLDK
ncbi:hypothetical protein AALA17_05115 [Lactobacillaceae bacterium 24-114]